MEEQKIATENRRGKLNQSKTLLGCLSTSESSSSMLTIGRVVSRIGATTKGSRTLVKMSMSDSKAKT
jgi:hypothetical protein